MGVDSSLRLRSELNTSRMEASKKAKSRAEKAEEEVLELMNKARQLETELDVTAESRDRRDQDHGARRGVESCCQQPQVPRGRRGEGQPERGILQRTDQDPDRQAKAGRGQSRVRREVRTKVAEGG